MCLLCCVLRLFHVFRSVFFVVVNWLRCCACCCCVGCVVAVCLIVVCVWFPLVLSCVVSLCVWCRVGCCGFGVRLLCAVDCLRLC